jgi:hypothetical protein
MLFTIAELMTICIHRQSIIAAGYSSAQLREAKFTALELQQAGYTPKQLRGGGFSVDDVVTSGYDLRTLVAAGYSVKLLRKAGITYDQLKTAGCTEEQLTQGGFATWKQFLTWILLWGNGHGPLDTLGLLIQKILILLLCVVLDVFCFPFMCLRFLWRRFSFYDGEDGGGANDDVE